jgi:hypothetical protein
MRKSCFAGLAFITFLTGCFHENTATIDNGVYREPAGVEAVTIQDHYMTLQLNMTKGLRPGLQSRRYEYELMSNGRLTLNGSSNDEFFLFAVITYDWLWDGKNIVRKHSDTGETVVFSRE